MHSSSDYIVLARKYRPQSLNDVVGQDVLVKALEKAITDNQLSHGMLLHGIRGIGKTTTARIIAKGLNCEKGPTAHPCGVCTSCTSIQQDRHLDVIEMDAASHTGVDDMREIIETAKYRAVQGRFKVYIIDEVHMLSKSAFNALLKTLEEPPPNVKFIFATTEIQKVPDTILSRCMRFDLKRMDTQTIEARLFYISTQENLTLDQEAATLMARAAEGSMRDALSLMDQSIVLAQSPHITGDIVRSMLGLSSFEATTDLLTAVFKGEERTIFEHTQTLFQQGTEPLLLLRDLVERLYQVICLKTHPELLKSDMHSHNFFTEHEKQALIPLAQMLSMPALLQAWQMLNDRYAKVERSPLPQQSLQVILLQLCYVSNLPSLQEIIETGKILPAQKNDGSEKPLTVTAPSSCAAHSSLEIPSVKISSVGISANIPSVDLSASHLKSFENVLELLQEKREPLLYTHAYTDMDAVSFAHGHIKIHTKPSAPSTLITQLKQFLEKHTSTPWIIDHLGVSEHVVSLKDKEVQKTEVLRRNAINHNTVQSILETFKGAAILPARDEK